MKRFLLIFTVVLLGASICGLIGANQALAAKTPTTPDLSDEKHPAPPPTDAELARAKIVHLSPAPPVVLQEIEQEAYYHKFRNSLSLRAGIEWLITDLQNPGLSFGVLYAFPLRDLRGVEAGADLNPNGSGTLHFARRQLIGNEKFRWFYKYGAGVRVVGSDQLVTFLRLRNWEARGGGGFEWTLLETMSFRFDTEALIATESQRVLATGGVAFAF